MPLIFPVAFSIATTDGSFSTMPSPRTQMSVFAGPRSTAISFAGLQTPSANFGQRMGTIRLSERKRWVLR